MRPCRWLLVVVLICVPSALVGQEWNAADAAALVARATVRRAAAMADSGLRDYRARAHGFVFFLAQLGEGLSEPPRLVKSDELELEVYWRAPGHSKQRIIGWRDRADLPTDIRYHQDHLGIVQNNFANRIRLGHGDEVRDVPHPLSTAGAPLYDFALGDPVVLRLPRREVRVRELLVRPKDFGAPRVIGSLFVDVETADLVVFRFNFTRAAYLDNTLEDITIVLENGLWNERYWLPRRQEIEIRRRTAWLDLPARGIIRGRWEIDEYSFNLGLADSLFFGPEIVAAPEEVRDSFEWEEPLDIVLREATGRVATFDLERVRGEIGELAGAHALSGLATTRLSVGSISDLAHVNRVEGLTLGIGWLFRPGAGPWELRVASSYGFDDARVKGSLGARYTVGRWTLELLGERAVLDVSDEPVISSLLNSVLAQEGGNDHGDYYLADRALVTVRLGLGAREFVAVTAGVERTQSLDVVADPASGTYRDNPPLGSETLGVARISAGRRSAALGAGRGVSGVAVVELGFGRDTRYTRLGVTGRVQVPVSGLDIVGRVQGGWGSGDLPSRRSFVFGGRGTLMGEPFRAWGGRYAVFTTVEWRIPVPFPAIPLGPFVSTGRQLVVAPFVGLGWAGGGLAGMPWVPSQGARPVVGIGVEWFHRLLRADFAVRLRDPGVALIFDIRRDLWEIL